MKDIGAKIRKIRELKGFTQQYMADQLMMSQNNYSKTELGLVRVPADRLQKIATILGITSEKLLTFDENQVFDNDDLPTYLPTYLPIIAATCSNNFPLS